MAGTPAVHSGLLLSLTAELEKVARLCCLPSGWTCHPSLRLTPKGASLLVHWSPSPAAETNRAKGGKTKRRKRSAASQKRSAERAALHKARQGSSVPRQPLNPAAAPFTQTPIPPAPNSVPAAGQSAAADSERVEGRIEGSRLAHPVVVQSSESSMVVSGPGEEDSAGRGMKRRAEPNREEVSRFVHLLCAEWSEGRIHNPYTFSLASKLDSLKGDGCTRLLFDHWAASQDKDR